MTGGYDAAFVAELSDSHTCPICHLGIKEPQLTLCGHHFCEGCLGPLVRDNKLSCPVCRTELTASQLFPNNALKRDILNLKINCDLHSEGCRWVGELVYREDHAKRCEYVTVSCPKRCGVQILRKDVEKHQTHQCILRVVACPDCLQTVTFTELTHHQEVVCLYVKEPCPKQCGELVMRQDIDLHKLSCPCEIVQCSNECGANDVQRKNLKAHLGQHCERRITRCNHCKEVMEHWELSTHLKSCGKCPVPCMHKCGTKVLRYEMRHHVGRDGSCPSSPLECDFSTSGCTFIGKREQLNRHLQENNLKHLRLVTNLVHRHEVRFQSVERQLRSTRATLTRRESELDYMKAEIATKLPALELPHLHEFVYLWKIDHWSKKFQDAVEGAVTRLTSGSLYSDHPGYRFFFGIFPNGAISHQGSHVSIFPYLETGEYDQELVWPVCASFEVTLIDQQPKGKDKYLLFNKECRAGASYLGGVTDLISHTDLGTRLFINNDRVLLKLCVKFGRQCTVC